MWVDWFGSHRRRWNLLGYLYLAALCFVFYKQFSTLTHLQKLKRDQNLTRENSLIFYVDHLAPLQDDIDCRGRVLFYADLPVLWGDFFVDGLSNYTLSPCHIDYVFQKPLERPSAGVEYVIIHKSHRAYRDGADALTGFAPRRRTDHYLLLQRKAGRAEQEQ